MELGGEPLGRFGRRVGLETDAPRKQSRALAVGLEIDPCDQAVVHQKGQDIIAVNPLVGGGVDLDPVAEPEQAFGSGPFPDERVERGEQCLANDPPRPPRIAVKIGLGLPAGDPGRDQPSFLDQLGDGRPGRLPLEPEIIPKVGRGRDSQRPRRPCDQGAMSAAGMTRSLRS